MTSTHANDPAAPGTRRARREAEERARREAQARGRGFAPAAVRRVARGAVLATLAGATVVLPLTGQGQPAVADPAVTGARAAADLPSTVEALTSATVDVTPPSSIAVSALPVDRSRVATAASRSQERAPLPGCTGRTPAAGANGELDPAALCTLWGTDIELLRADAATALAELNLAFRARFGRDLCVIDGYRSLAEQHTVKQQRGALAAVPGRSNHGWGLAIDLCPADTQGEAWDWIGKNGAVYGWENPAWAQPGGSGPEERWHWEYAPGVRADGEHYSS